MRRIFRNIASYLATDHTRNAEASYLHGSHDIFDLEHRQREIDRGLFRKTLLYRGFGSN